MAGTRYIPCTEESDKGRSGLVSREEQDLDSETQQNGIELFPFSTVSQLSFSSLPLLLPSQLIYIRTPYALHTVHI